MGWHVEVYAWKRGYYRKNHFDAGVVVNEFPVPVQDGYYASRLLPILHNRRALKHSERRKSSSPKLIWAFGLDNALIAATAFDRNIPLVYEVGDLRGIQIHDGLLGSATRRLESLVVARSSKVVVTSIGHARWYEQHYQAAIRGKLHVIENRLHPRAREMPRPRYPDLYLTETLRLGIAGYLRYADVAQALVDAVALCTRNVALDVYGDGPAAHVYRLAAERSSNITYHGPFVNPDDLAKIYSQLDVSLVVYDTCEMNVRLALPNKLFEAVYFAVPLLVVDGTVLAERVRDWGVGVVASGVSSEAIANAIDAIKVTTLIELRRRALAVKEDLLMDNGQDVRSIVTSL